MHRRRTLTLVVAVLALLLTGCGVTIGDPDDAPGRSTVAPTGSTGPTATGGTGQPTGAAEGTDQASDERLAVQITDRFWREAFPEAFQGSYNSPTVKGPYQGQKGPTCGGQPSVAFNAFYCPSQDFLAWDESLMTAGYQQIGDAWIYLIIAHEWGHAIQARLQRDQVSVAAELQADCLAGATLFGAARRGLVDLEPGDTAELQQTLEAVADDYPWTKESDHGDAQQRIRSFSTGAQGGVEACT